jgi:hypothetical protein
MMRHYCGTCLQIRKQLQFENKGLDVVYGPPLAAHLDMGSPVSVAMNALCLTARDVAPTLQQLDSLAFC